MCGGTERRASFVFAAVVRLHPRTHSPPPAGSQAVPSLPSCGHVVAVVWRAVRRGRGGGGRRLREPGQAPEAQRRCRGRRDRVQRRGGEREPTGPSPRAAWRGLLGRGEDAAAAGVGAAPVRVSAGGRGPASRSPRPLPRGWIGTLPVLCLPGAGGGSPGPAAFPRLEAADRLPRAWKRFRWGGAISPSSWGRERRGGSQAGSCPFPAPRRGQRGRLFLTVLARGKGLSLHLAGYT